MIIINKITTKTGDLGETLGPNSKKIPKHDIHIEFFGILDEANVALGSAIFFCNNKLIKHILKLLQHQLFDVGAAFYTQKENDLEKMINFLESNILKFNQGLKPLNSFLLPYGKQNIISLRQARCCVRKTERCFWQCKNQSSKIGVYLNRLSDLLFVFIRKTHIKENKWNHSSSNF